MPEDANDANYALRGRPQHLAFWVDQDFERRVVVHAEDLPGVVTKTGSTMCHPADW